MRRAWPEQLDVESGWEAAVETTLAGWLDAICVPDLDEPALRCTSPVQGRLPCLSYRYPPLVRSCRLPSDSPPAGALAAKVQAPWPLTGLLDGVQTAANLTEALANRAGLREGETLVTPEASGAVATGCGRAAARMTVCWPAGGKSANWKRR